MRFNMNHGTNTTLVGWTSSGTDRGTADILWSCCVTIILCIWVSTYPNVPSRHDRWYHIVMDKFNMAMIGMLGPDFVGALALSQLASARRSVKLFKDNPDVLGDRKWTFRHAFFADMGGFLLISPDYPDGFPVNAEQLFYLIKHRHIDFPSLSERDIKEKSKADSLSRAIILWQVSWFSLTQFVRLGHGYPMTTLELTTLSFSIFMVLTSLVWYLKPSISRSVDIRTKDDRNVEEIRELARQTTHPGLPDVWYQTPLYFLTQAPTHAAKSWIYMSRLSHLVHVPLFNRPITRIPWDRFPSDNFLPLDGSYSIVLPAAIFIDIPFSLSFLAAWTFHFPTDTEKWLWRVCALYHIVVTLSLSVYFVTITNWAVVAKFRELRARWTPGSMAPQDTLSSLGESPINLAIAAESRAQTDAKEASHEMSYLGGAWNHLQHITSSARTWLESWRNISPDQDPDMALPVRWVLSMWIIGVLYIFARLIIYVEDFMTLREQPDGIYSTVNSYFPFV